MSQFTPFAVCALLCLVLFSGEASARMMGFYGTPNASNLAGWGNAWYSSSPQELVSAKKQYGYDSQLFYLGDHFLTRAPKGQTGIRLITNWASVWENTWKNVSAELLANQTIIGFFLGDELMWNGLPYQELVDWSSKIRETFPTSFIWENEAVPVYNCPAGSTPVCDKEKHIYHCCDMFFNAIPGVQLFGIPPALNVTSIDLYDWNNNTAGLDLVNRTRTFYELYLYPRKHQHTHFFVVPGSAASTHNPACDLNCYEQIVMQDANNFVQWMKEDKKIKGMMPWTWKSCGKGCIPPKDEIGTMDMPQASKHWKEVIGPAVMKMKQY